MNVFGHFRMFRFRSGFSQCARNKPNGIHRESSCLQLCLGWEGNDFALTEWASAGMTGNTGKALGPPEVSHSARDAKKDVITSNSCKKTT